MGKESTFGAFLKEKRIALGKTLRQFCLENKLDPGNHSKLERGRNSPPQGEKLHALAAQLELQEGSDDWYALFDLAAAEKGRIPDDILNDEELVGKLPILFRTIRGEELTKEQLIELAETIRRA